MPKKWFPSVSYCVLLLYLFRELTNGACGGHHDAVVLPSTVPDPTSSWNKHHDNVKQHIVSTSFHRHIVYPMNYPHGVSEVTLKYMGKSTGTKSQQRIFSFLKLLQY